MALAPYYDVMHTQRRQNNVQHFTSYLQPLTNSSKHYQEIKLKWRLNDFWKIQDSGSLTLKKKEV